MAVDLVRRPKQPVQVQGRAAEAVRGRFPAATAAFPALRLDATPHSVLHAVRFSKASPSFADRVAASVWSPGAEPQDGRNDGRTADAVRGPAGASQRPRTTTA
ncbi:hypothetical protein JCM9533A_85210 [Catenuloplanes niger JCM 9533]